MADATGTFGAGGALGAVDALKQILMQRIAEKQYADKMRQQEFENSLKTRSLDQNDALRRDSLSETRRLHDIEDQRNKAMEADRQDRLDQTLNETIPPNTFLEPASPVVGRLQPLGALKPQDERPAVDTGPLLPGDTGEAKKQGFLKVATYKQQKDTAEQEHKAQDLQRKTEADAANADVRNRMADIAGQNADVRGRMADIAGQNAELKAQMVNQKAAQGPKLPQREDDTVVSIHQMMPLVDELLSSAQSRLKAKGPAATGVLGQVGERVKRAGEMVAYKSGFAQGPDVDKRIQLASLLQILGTVPYLRGIRNMQFVHQIQQHLADPAATDESIAERLSTLKQILPGMEQAIYDVHNGGQIPHAHTGAMAPQNDPLGIRR